MPEAAAALPRGLALPRALPPLLPLKVRGLGFADGGRRLIDGIDLDIDDAGITTVMGPNGAGKSLLVRLLHGLLAPSAGEISWNGQAMGEAVRARQAMVFQKPVLLRRSVAANIDFVLKLSGRADAARRDRILDEAGLLGHAGQPARLLSGGEQQRLALARALATGPEVLFLDEPTASLDPASVQRFEEVVELARRRGVKIILVTHDQGQARRLAGDIAFVHRGRLLEHGEARRFLSNPESQQARAYLDGRLVI